MNKKFIAVIGLFILCVAVSIGLSVWVLSNINFSGTSEVTINGDTTTYYSGDIYYSELNRHVRDFITLMNEHNLGDTDRQETDEVIATGAEILDQVESLTTIDNISGSGVVEMNQAVSAWLDVQRQVIDQDYSELFNYFDSDGKPQSQADADSANAIIDQIEQKIMNALEELYAAMDEFEAVNQ